MIALIGIAILLAAILGGLKWAIITTFGIVVLLAVLSGVNGRS